MADVIFRTVTESTISGTGTVDFVAAGEFGGALPKAAIFIYTRANDSSIVSANFNRSIGYSDGTNNVAVANAQSSGESASNATRYPIDTRCWIVGNASGTLAGGLATFIPDGARFEITSNSIPSGASLTCILIGGSDVSDVIVGKQDYSVGTTTVTTGFEPDLVFMLGESTTASATNNTVFSEGVVINDGLDTQRGMPYGNVSGQSTMVINSGLYDTGTQIRTYNNAESWVLRATNFSATGFQLTTVSGTATTSYAVRYLAIKFATKPDIGLVDISIPTTGNYSETGFGFQPDFGYMTCLSEAATRNTMLTSGITAMTSIAFDANGVYSESASTQDGVATSSVWAQSAPRHLSLNSSGGVALDSSGYAFTSSGWDVTVTTNPVTPLLGYALAIGPGGAPPVGVQEMYIKDGGIFVKYTPHVKVGGTFQEVDAYVLEGGAWVPVHEK